MNDASRYQAVPARADLRRGMLLRTMKFEDGKGRRSTLKERRLVSMADMHLAALEVSITAENWVGNVTIRSGIDGRVVNAGAKLYRKFNNKHLVPLAANSWARMACRCLCAQSVEHPHRAGRPHASVPRRTTSRCSTPRDRRTGLHRAGMDGRAHARHHAHTGEDRFPFIVRAITPSRSVAWKRAKPSCARDVSRR